MNNNVKETQLNNLFPRIYRKRQPLKKCNSVHQYLFIYNICWAQKKYFCDTVLMSEGRSHDHQEGLC